MDRDRLYAKLVAGAMNAQRNLAAVGDQKLLNCHVGLLDDDERLVEFDRL